MFVKRSLKSQNPDSHCNQVKKKKKKKKEKGLAMEIVESKKEGEPLWSTIPRCKELLSKKKKKEKKTWIFETVRRRDRNGIEPRI